MDKRTTIWMSISAFALVIFLIGGWLWLAPAADQSPELTGLIEADTSGYARATEPGGMIFPRDFGPHNDYLTEWWYYTGNLTASDGREFGYQFTIFRRALSPESPPQEGSDWRSNQIYLAHFTVSDIANETFYKFEKISRAGADLAGATADPYHVWLENWFVRENEDGSIALSAQTGEVTLDLTLQIEQPPVLHGDGGLSAKGPEPGNASYYYSLVNQTTSGTLTIEGEEIAVTGRSWKDHEYSTSALSEDAIGWDWFSIQFDEPAGSALVLWQIRREDGSISEQSAGSWINPDSSTIPLDPSQFEITVLETWTSPESGAEYPIRWEIAVPSLDLALTAEALMPNQELLTTPIYWEGAVRYQGSYQGESVTATGYIEMTGYAQPMRVRI